MNPSQMQVPDRVDSERVYLRPYKDGDGSLIWAASRRNRIHLQEFEAENLLMHLRDEVHAESVVQEICTKRHAREWFLLGVFERRTDQWLGQVYLAPTNWDLPEFTIGYMADVNHEGRGYISESVKAILRVLFVNVGAYRIISDCNEHNVRSWRLLERCGFRREGHLRENKRSPEGSLHGDYLYGMLRREFETL